MVPIADTLKKLRSAQGLTQRQLARLSGVSLSVVREIENEQMRPDPQTVQVLGEALGIEPVELTDD